MKLIEKIIVNLSISKNIYNKEYDYVSFPIQLYVDNNNSYDLLYNCTLDHIHKKIEFYVEYNEDNCINFALTIDRMNLSEQSEDKELISVANEKDNTLVKGEYKKKIFYKSYNYKLFNPNYQCGGRYINIIYTNNNGNDNVDIH